MPSKTSLPNDTRVRVCNARHAGVAAIGVVQSQEPNDCFRVQLTAITKPGTKLMFPSGKKQALQHMSLGDSVLWKRKRLRLLPASWSIDDHLHLIGRTWTDPCHDGGSFIVTGLFMHADGCFVDYRNVEDADKDDAQLPKEKKPYSELAEVLRWLGGDFSDNDEYAVVYCPDGVLGLNLVDHDDGGVVVRGMDGLCPLAGGIETGDFIVSVNSVPVADIDGSCDSLVGRVSANIKETKTPQLIIRRSQRNNAKAANASSDKRPKLARAWPTRGGDDQDHGHADGHDGHPYNSSGPSLDPPEGVGYGANNLEEIDDKNPFIGPKAHWDQDDYELWKSVRVKLDAVHAVMRFERALRKKHGAYAHFMSRLRDAIFMINNDDVAALKQVLKARWFKRRTPVPDDELRAAVDKDVEQ